MTDDRNQTCPAGHLLAPKRWCDECGTHITPAERLSTEDVEALRLVADHCERWMAEHGWGGTWTADKAKLDRVRALIVRGHPALK